MTRYDIKLAIRYHYAHAVRDARHILRVVPRAGHGQIVETLALDVCPAPFETATEGDFFGNRCDHLLLRDAHEDLRIEMRARVAVDRPPPELVGLPSLDDIRTLARCSRDGGGDGPAQFLGSGRMVGPSREVADFFTPVAAQSAGIGEAAMGITHLIHREFRFQSGVSSVRTRVAETFATRRGVCQDFAHLTIAGLRGLGVPAAYVSGFLRTAPPPGQKRLEGADAMHAWVEVWTGEDTGWIGFDPTNECFAGNDHVVVARGRDYADVAPIDGVLMTSGPQRHHHAVDMTPIDD